MSIQAFELVPIVENLVQGKAGKTQITCIESFQESLYIGTNDGFLLFYLAKLETSPSGKHFFRSAVQKQVHLGSTKPIEKILYLPRRDHLAVLHDGKILQLSGHDLKLVEDSKVIKGNNFARNERVDIGANDSAADMSVFRKKKGVFNYEMIESMYVPDKALKDLLDNEHKEILAMARDGEHLCVASLTGYHISNLRTGAILDLFPYDASTEPLVKRIGPSEFLLSFGTEGMTMGMFVNENGDGKRSPLRWVLPPSCLAFQHPYVVSLCAAQDLIAVHSILDQENKQVLNVSGGCCLSDSSELIYVACTNALYALVPTPLDQQIDDLLAQRRVDEALSLAQEMVGRGMEEGDLEEEATLRKKMELIQQKGGFAYLATRRYREGLALLSVVACDPREVLSLFPGLLSPKSSFVPLLSLQHGIKSIPSLATSDEDKTNAYVALADYLRSVRHEPFAKAFLTEIDTALVKIYSMTDGSALVRFLTSERPLYVDLDAASSDLTAHSSHHALALLFFPTNPQKSFEIWKKIELKELQDTSYPGIDSVISAMCTINDPPLIFSHAKWILAADEAKGVSIFLRPASSDPAQLLRHDEVMDFLQPYSIAQLAYLEHLVFTLNEPSERLHTRLGLLYQEAITRMGIEAKVTKNEGALVPAAAMRQKFRTLLQNSIFYDFEEILFRLKDSDDFLQECAILYGRLGQHDAALALLIHRLEDHEAAKHYCYEFTKDKDRATKQKLFLSLLRAYLAPDGGARSDKDYSQQAIDLLNSHVADFDVAEVLSLVPEDWAIGILDRFLRRAIRTTLHERRACQVERALAKAQLIQLKAEHLLLTTPPVRITETTACAICKHSIYEDPFVCYPNGVIAHKKCAKDLTVCPVKGTRFRP